MLNFIVNHSRLGLGKIVAVENRTFNVHFVSEEEVTFSAAQREANGKSTEIFTKTFYARYKQGNSSAEALQKAALELIKNKSNNLREPYYRAIFTLNGDFR